MRTAFTRIESHEVDARWGEALDGVTTTIRDPDGWLLTADEFLHLRTNE